MPSKVPRTNFSTLTGTGSVCNLYVMLISTNYMGKKKTDELARWPNGHYSEPTEDPRFGGFWRVPRVFSSVFGWLFFGVLFGGVCIVFLSVFHIFFFWWFAPPTSLIFWRFGGGGLQRSLVFLWVFGVFWRFWCCFSRAFLAPFSLYAFFF